MKIATYGTLKAGHRNHHIIREAKPLGEATVKGYKLYYSGGQSGFPVAVPSDDDYISVEVYEVTKEMRDNMDWLEGYSESAPRERCLYTRENVVTTGGVQTEMYVGGECWTKSRWKHGSEVPRNGSGVYEWS